MQIFRLIPYRPGTHWSLSGSRGEVSVRARSSGEARFIAARAEAAGLSKPGRARAEIGASAFINPALYAIGADHSGRFPVEGEARVLAGSILPPEDEGEASEAVSQVAALPWRAEADGSLSILLVTSRTNAKWMLPKGWPMEGMTDWLAAQQEALEEAGVNGEVSDTPIGSYRFARLEKDGSSRPATAAVYPLRVTHEQAEWKERGQRERRWFEAGAAAATVFEPDLRRLLVTVATGATNGLTERRSG